MIQFQMIAARELTDGLTGVAGVTSRGSLRDIKESVVRASIFSRKLLHEPTQATAAATAVNSFTCVTCQKVRTTASTYENNRCDRTNTRQKSAARTTASVVFW